MNCSNEMNDDEIKITWHSPSGMIFSKSEIHDVEQLCNDILTDEYYFDESDCWILNLIVEGIFRSY